MKTLALGVLAVIVVVVLAGAAIWPSVSDAPWEVENNNDAPPTPAPTTQARFLTSSEAAGLAEAYNRDLILAVDLTAALSVTCETEDYNDRSQDWIVRCTIIMPNLEPRMARWRVSDSTGSVSPMD